LEDIEPAELVFVLQSVSYQYLCLIDPVKINESSLDVHGDQLNTNPVTEIDALNPLLHPFNRHIEKPNPVALSGCARNQGLKFLADSRFEQGRSYGFADLPFHFVGSILLFCALSRQIIQSVNRQTFRRFC
jgi:hypothetical protein